MAVEYSFLTTTSEIIVNAGPRSVVIYESVGIASSSRSFFKTLVSKITEELVNLTQVFPFGDRCILNDCAPTVWVRQASISNSFEEVVSRIDCSNRTIQCLVYNFAGAKEG
jgi:hypothetical protein